MHCDCVARRLGYFVVVGMSLAACGSDSGNGGQSPPTTLVSAPDRSPMVTSTSVDPTVGDGTDRTAATVTAVESTIRPSPNPAPPTTVIVETDIETPAEAAAVLTSAGVVCDSYLASEEPATTNLGLTPAVDGFCESGDLTISISVFPDKYVSFMLDASIPPSGGMYRDFGMDEVWYVADGTVLYSAEPADGSTQAVPSETVRELLTRIAEATGGELKTYEF